MRVLLAASLGLALVSPGTAVATVGSLDFRDCVSSDAATTGCTNISATTSGLDALTHAVVVSPDGGSVYTAAESGDDVAHFSRDLATGTVTFKNCIAAGDAPAAGCSDIGATTNVLNGPTAIVISRDGTDVYVAGGPGIAHLRRDALSGVLTFADCITSVPTTTGCGPVTPTTTSIGSLETLKFGSDEHHLYAGGSGSVVHLTRSVVDGSLSFADCISGSAVTGCTDISATTNAFSSAESVAPSADGKNLYVSGDATVYNMSLDVAGAPLFGDCVTTRTATTGCTDLSATNAAFGALENVAISPDGGNVYLAAQGGGLSTMTRNATTGTLTFDSCIASFATAGCTDISATNGALTGLDAVTVSQDNRSVYTAGGGTAAHLVRTPGSGALTPADCLSHGIVTGCTDLSASTSGFSDLQELTLSPGGESAYAASEDTDTLVHLRRQLAPTCTGAAIAVAHDAATPVALACHDANG